MEMETTTNKAAFRHAFARGSVRHQIETIFRYLLDDAEELTPEHFDETKPVYQRPRLRKNGTWKRTAPTDGGGAGSEATS